MALAFTVFLFFLLMIAITPPASSVSFNFSSFGQNSQQPACSPDSDGICFQGDAFFNMVVQLTKNQVGVPISDSHGRAVYSKPVRLWDRDTGQVTDFTTHFSFKIDAFNMSQYGDGLAFFLSPYPSQLPPNSTGGYLGLVSGGAPFNTSNINSFVAVEFDSFSNDWDPSADHLGINVNSIKSAVTNLWSNGIKRGDTANAWVTYNSSTSNLAVFLTYADNPTYNGTSSLSYKVDLREVLPEYVAVGFTAATGFSYEIHNILSWSFSSSLEVDDSKKNNNRVGLIAGIVAGVVAVAAVVSFVWFILRRKRSRRRGKKEEIIGRDDDDEFSIDEDEFEKGRGPKRFPYDELAAATKNFAEEGKLGQGGFGSVYKGFLSDLKIDAAIKRVSKGSSQGKKEYIAEVKIISQLRHRNLVQLIGWCHDRGDLLLVYEFMPNGSLDAHLFRAGPRLLRWPERHRIALGLAFALLYLHEEWEQCVLHRDVKSSNVMLDSAFNAKLGDFGLARLVDHDRGSQTTVLAGTMGYLAPECVTAGKASKESDVYSFGVVALEIACGRRPVEPQREAGRVGLVEWVWGLYGRGAILEAVDQRLEMEYEAMRMERLMVVGLWCAHPDYGHRPSIRQAIGVLNMEAPLPLLPSKMPVPTYYAPPMSMLYSYTSSTGTNTTSTGTTTSTSNVSSVSTSMSLLKSHHTDAGLM